MSVRPRERRVSRRSIAQAAAICLIGVAGAQACSAGGADESFWDPGGNPAPGGTGGDTSGQGGDTTTGQGPSTTTGNGPSTTTGQGAGTTVSSSSHTSTTGAGAGTTVSSSSSTTSTSTSTSSSSGGVTWTEIYNGVFGPSGTSTCTGSSCHTKDRSGFTCGTTASSCYTGFVDDGYVTPGSGATGSAIVDPSQTCLCGSGLSGNMPKDHACLTAAQITEIKTWLAAGAPNN